MSQQPIADIFGVAVLIAALLFSSEVAAVVGPYMVIVLAATLGASFKVARREKTSRTSAVLFFLRVVGMAVLFTSGLAAALNAYRPELSPRVTVAPIALLIGFDKQRECIDYGGSAGLLTRLMRDSGFKYLAYDAYDDSKYANYFKVNRLENISPGLVTAFEVFEHFPQPAESIGELFAIKPDLIVFSTVFYEGQGSEWEYLVPYCGQHIFFYREQALRAFGERHGYALRRSQDFWLMIRETSPYLAAFVAKHTAAVDAAFVGELFLRVGYGTEQTYQDYSYAKDRFISELGTVRSAVAKPKNWLRRFLGLA